MTYIEKSGLKIGTELFDFIESAAKGTPISADQFWAALADGIATYAPVNASLLDKRASLQQQINAYHMEHGQDYDFDHYKSFLSDIGYIVPTGNDFSIETANVDPEIATISGPQLVVPIKNARFAINAANARWGSLYDAYYGTDAIPFDLADKGSSYNAARGALVIKKAKAFLDDAAALLSGSHADATKYFVENGTLKIQLGDDVTTLENQAAFKGYTGDAAAPTGILLQHHHLHFEIQIDAGHYIGKDDKAHMKEIIMESAVTAIMDCEDSVAAVDAEDKAECYANMKGLFAGDLSVEMQKGGKTFTRAMHEDRQYTDGAGNTISLPGRSLILVRNVGHLMTNPAVLFNGDQEIPEGLMDTYVTALLAHYDISKPADHTRKNSKTGSIYIVKPKMHGPEEVAFAVEMFGAAEAAMGLPKNTLKIGIMDEERRTTVNLKECIRAAKERVIFINTGFLDRTGDEIHTSMFAGSMERKDEIKNCVWLSAYEDWNVDNGLAAGFQHKAQIGKGMWPKPDEMQEMMRAKIAHPKAGADCAWAPSPTAATLHALHYHMVDVDSVQDKMLNRNFANLDDILTVPLARGKNFSADEITQELQNNCQGILGYVVRWVDQGVGCSKVPDIHNVGLMEDRATLRISSQHIANWLHHGLVTDEQVIQTMQEMAKVVDDQNAGDTVYEPMHGNFDTSIAFMAACDLVFKGKDQPSGYTEPLLHKRRLEKKAQQG